MSTCPRKIFTVVGTRPQFIKASIVSRYLRQLGSNAPIQELLVHTGQHYDPMLSDVFFQDLEVPSPDFHLGVGSDVAPAQIARMLERLAILIDRESPHGILVYGDTNSTIAAAMAAAYSNIPLIHVEAGERIFRRTDVPEEINRVLTDNCASLCLTCTKRASTYLEREGFSLERIRFVGDPMYDLFCWAKNNLDRFAKLTLDSVGLEKGAFHLATIHRVQNTVSREVLFSLLDILDHSTLAVLLPVHPRVRCLLDRYNWSPKQSLRLIEPLGYFDFLRLLLACDHCITDSGGVMREAFFAGRPSVIPMENSWWSQIVECGWALETGVDRSRILDALDNFRPSESPPKGLFGDGNSAMRIISEISNFFEEAGKDKAWHRHGSFDRLPRVRSTDFTYDNYRGLLGALQMRGYTFAGFPDAQRLRREGEQFILMRHDIDFDLEKAFAMAQLEAQAGVRATYFFLVRTTHYSVFSKKGSDIVRQILKLGHHLGLHFDCSAYPEVMELSNVAQECAKEVRMLQDWFGSTVSIVSFHRPYASGQTRLPDLLSGLQHTYMEPFVRDMYYCSDSRGEWKDGPPSQSEAFVQGYPLHILIHPIWWNKYPTSPYETLLQFLDRQINSLEQSMADNCSIYKPPIKREEE